MQATFVTAASTGTPYQHLLANFSRMLLKKLLQACQGILAHPLVVMRNLIQKLLHHTCQSQGQDHCRLCFGILLAEMVWMLTGVVRFR